MKSKTSSEGVQTEKANWIGDNALETFNKLHKPKEVVTQSKFVNEALDHLQAMMGKGNEADSQAGTVDANPNTSQTTCGQEAGKGQAQDVAMKKAKESSQKGGRKGATMKKVAGKPPTVVSATEKPAKRKAVARKVKADGGPILEKQPIQLDSFNGVAGLLGTPFSQQDSKENQTSFNLNVWGSIMASQPKQKEVVEQKSVSWLDSVWQAASHEMAGFQQPLGELRPNVV